MNNIRPVSETEFRPTAKASEFRGILHKYANPDLIKYEKYAGAMHAMKKYGMDVTFDKELNRRMSETCANE